MGGVQVGPRPAARVFDVDAIRRVPGGIASRQARLVVTRTDRPQPTSEARG